MRYQNKNTLIVSNELYARKLIDRGLSHIEIEQVPDLTYPTPQQVAKLEIALHAWKVGDRLYKLAHEHYGDSRLWWVISFFNKRPTEAHYKLGDTVRIPFPLDKVLDYMSY